MHSWQFRNWRQLCGRSQSRAPANLKSWISPQIAQRSRVVQVDGTKRKSSAVVSKPLLNARPVLAHERIKWLIVILDFLFGRRTYIANAAIEQMQSVKCDLSS